VINGGNLSMTNGTISTLSFGSSGLDLASTGASTLSFDIQGVNGDAINSTGSLTLGNGNVIINLNNVGMAAGVTNTLMTWGSQSGSGSFTIGSYNNLGFGLNGIQIITNATSLQVTALGSSIATAYWAGNLGTSWTNNDATYGNFATNSGQATGNAPALPSGVTDVYFAQATNSTNTLGQTFLIKSLNFIGGSTTTIAADGNSLTVLAGGLNVEAGSTASVLVTSSIGAGTNSGTLTLGSATITGAFGNTATLSNAGSVTIASGGFLSNSGTYSGTGTITIGTGGTLLNAAGGTLNLANALTNNGVLANAGTFAPTVAISGTGVVSNTGTMTLSVANTYSGGTVLNGGVLNFTNGNAFGSGTISFGGGSLSVGTNGVIITNTIAVNSTGTISAANIAAGSQFQLSGNAASGIIVAGSGTLVFTGNGTLSDYAVTGSNYQNNFKLNYYSNSFTGNYVITNGASVEVNGTTFNPASSLTLASNGALIIDGTTFGAGTIVANGGYLELNNNSANVASAIQNNSGLNVLTRAFWNSTAAYNNGTISGVISGNGGLTLGNAFSQGGSVTLTATNTYLGDTTIFAGNTLRLNGLLGGGNYAGAFTNNGTLNYSNSAAQTLGNFAGSGTVNVYNGTLSVNGNIGGSVGVTGTGGTTSTLVVNGALTR
jgi:hypothetical protein